MHDFLIKQKYPSLNIGPGNAFLEKFLPSSHIKISLDKNIKCLKYYKGIQNIHLINAVAEQIPLRNNSIPTVTTQATFQIMRNQIAFLMELHRIIMPKGFFIITICYHSRHNGDPFKISSDSNQDEIDKLKNFIEQLKLIILDIKYLDMNGKWVSKKSEGFSLWIIGKKEE